MTDYTEVLKLGKLSSQRNIDNINKEYFEINLMNISDDKDSDERDRISENDGKIVTDDMKVLKLGKLSSWENIENIEK